MVTITGWYQYGCAHCGIRIQSRHEVTGLSYCSPACGDHLDAGDDGDCVCVSWPR